MLGRRWSQFLQCVPHHLHDFGPCWRPFSRLSMLNWWRSPLVREVTLIGCLNQCIRRETKVRKATKWLKSEGHSQKALFIFYRPSQDMNVFTTWPSGMKQVNTNWNHLSESGVKMAVSRWFIITTVIKIHSLSGFPSWNVNIDNCHLLEWKVVSSHAGAERTVHASGVFKCNVLSQTQVKSGNATGRPSSVLFLLCQFGVSGA